jgi:photosystem II stability/assembly factor-like uncharacterized protein
VEKGSEMGQNWAISSTTSPAGSNLDGRILQGMMRLLTIILILLLQLGCSKSDETDDSAVGSNSGYFAAGQDGTIVTSSDGINWKQLDSGTPQSFRKISYGNGKLVAVGDMATIVYSADTGKTWNSSNDILGFASETFDGINFINDKFYATSWGNSGGSLLQSSDALNWTEAKKLSSLNGYFNFIYGDSVYLAVGDNGSIKLTSDLVNWNEYFASNSITLYDIVYCKGLYVAVGSDSVFTSGGLFWSDSGLTWNSVSFAPNVSLFGVTCGDNEFIAVGSSGLILKSNDGKTWAMTGSSVTNSILLHPIYANGKYLVVGDNGTVVISSDGGESWTAQSAGVEKWLGSVVYVE